MSGDMFAVGRFVLSGLLTIGGIAAIYLGYRLFRSGSGLSKGVDKLDFKSELGKVSFAGMSVGGLLMLTSGVWGTLAYFSVPKLELASNLTRITKSDQFERYKGSSLGNLLLGATVVGSDKQALGTISNVLMDNRQRANAFIVTGLKDDSQPVLVYPEAMMYGSSGTASIQMTKEQFERLISESLKLDRSKIDTKK